MALLAVGLVLLPWRPARAVIGQGMGPQWHGSHTEGILFYANDHRRIRVPPDHFQKQGPHELD